MQDKEQFELLMLLYNQLKNGALEIQKMIDNEDFKNAMTMVKSREAIFLNCKCMRNYLELTREQEEALNKLLDERRDLEMTNIKKLSVGMDEVLQELRISHKTEKIQQLYKKLLRLII